MTHKQEYNLSREFYVRVLRNRPLAETESVYWKYKHHLNWLRHHDIEYNQRLDQSMINKRKKYLEEKLK